MDTLTSISGYLLSWSDDVLGQWHVIAAVLALMSGFIVILAKKGTFFHQISGTTYFVSMLVVNGSALAKFDLTGGINLFHIAACLSLMTLLPAYYFLLRFRQSRRIHYVHLHGKLMIWSYFGLLMALVAESVTRSFPFMLHGEGGWLRFSLFLTVTMFVGGAMCFQLMKKIVP